METNFSEILIKKLYIFMENDRLFVSAAMC